MTREELFQLICKKESFLCIGLDSDITKIPKHLLDTEDPVFEFNKKIIDATHEFTVAYKPNMAFYESRGAKGLQSLEKTMNYIEGLDSEVFTIADAKRGDIGNSSALYARTFFDKSSSGFEFDSITVAPYMGKDSIEPFYGYEGKWVIILALTSNPGFEDFQTWKPQNMNVLKKYGIRGNKDRFLYEEVLRKSREWGKGAENTMYVVGATRSEFIGQIRKLIPDHFMLVPGVGKQGGSLEEVAMQGFNDKCGLLVNSSRGIIYASVEKDFDEQAKVQAKDVQQQMKVLLRNHNII